MIFRLKQRVFWRDPEGLTSGAGTVEDAPDLDVEPLYEGENEDELIYYVRKDDGSEVECYGSELEPLNKSRHGGWRPWP